MTRTPNGKFYDGKTARPHDVTIEPSSSFLKIYALDNSVLKNWSYNEINVLEDAEPPLPAKLTSKREPDARLLVTEYKDWLRIRDHLPVRSLPRRLPTGLLSWFGYCGFAVAVLVFAYGYAGKIFEAGSVFIPRSIESKLGESAIAALISDAVCTAPKGRKAIEKIIARLEEGTGHKNNYTIYVVQDNATVNALSAPGNNLILFSGVLDKAESPEEVIGVLAHEMAHGELRHPVRGLVRDIGYSLLFNAMLGGSGDTGRIAAFLSQMSYSRGDELAADAEGQKILVRAKLNPQDMTRFFERLREEEKKEESAVDAESYGMLVYLSTHPLTSERIKRLEAAKIPAEKTKPVLTHGEWSSLKKICTETKARE